MKCSRPPKSGFGRDSLANNIFSLFCLALSFFLFPTTCRRRSLVPSHLISFPPFPSIHFIHVNRANFFFFLSSHRNACVESIVDTFCISLLCITALQAHICHPHTSAPLTLYALRTTALFCSFLRHTLHHYGTRSFFFFTHTGTPRRSTYSNYADARTYYTCTYTAYTRRRFFSVTITISERLMSKR